MRTAAALFASLLLAAEASAAVVVLSNGKRLDVVAYKVNGNYVIVQYATGRVESYPLSVVDLAATRVASGERPAVAPTPPPAGPRSPFGAAKSEPRKGTVAITDADVMHVTAGAADEQKKEGEPAGQVTLVGFDKKKVAEGQWDITATVANQAANPVSGVTARVRVLDSEGKTIATGTGTLPGQLEAGKQGNVTARVAIQEEPIQLAVDLTWQEIRPVEKPGAAATPPPAAKPQAETPQAAATPPPGWSIPANASPNSLPTNAMALPQPNNTGTAPQVPREKPTT